MKIAATVPGTAFFALVLFVFDLWYRWDQLAPLKVQHIYVYLALFFLLLFVRSLGSLTRVAWIDG
ncbi:hypothetical protein ACFL1S_09485, partial [Pseudomonadota bacterium]